MTIYFLSWFVKNKLNRGRSFWQIFFTCFSPEVIDLNAPTKMVGIVNKVDLFTNKKTENVYLTFCQKHKKILPLLWEEKKN